MAGVRKFDYPPMFNQSAAWWNDYRALNDYIARICAAMSLGEQRKRYSGAGTYDLGMDV